MLVRDIRTGKLIPVASAQELAFCGAGLMHNKEVRDNYSKLVSAVRVNYNARVR